MKDLQQPIHYRYYDLELYKKCFVEFKNSAGKKLALSTINQNKYPSLLIENGNGNYDIVGIVKQPVKLVKWLQQEGM